MKFNWHSQTTEVLLNPSIPTSAQQHIKENLNAFGLEGHVWVGTSGSSTELKWVALAKEAILASAHAVNQHLKSTQQDIWITALPDFHVGGLGIWARSHLSGASVIDFKQTCSKWNPVDFYQLAKDSQATLTALVPAQIYDLVVNGLQAPGHLRAVIVGGGALEECLYHKAVALGWKLLPSYGLTECASQVATAEVEASLNMGIFPEMRILPHVKVTINESGLIRIQGASLLSGYAYPTSTGFQFVDPKTDAAFLTEDLGECRGPSLKVFGRLGSFIKIGGESVNMSRLEKIFEEGKIKLGITADMALIAVPDQRLGHSVHLASTVPVAILEPLIDYFRDHVLPFERVRQVHEVEAIPRTSLNKLRRQELLLLIQEVI